MTRLYTIVQDGIAVDVRARSRKSAEKLRYIIRRGTWARYATMQHPGGQWPKIINVRPANPRRPKQQAAIETGPVQYGWRSFKYDSERGILVGANAQPWWVRDARALCLASGMPRTPSQTRQMASRCRKHIAMGGHPTPECHCGIYVMYRPQLVDISNQVLCLCSCWGVMELCKWGLRTERCRIEMIFVSYSAAFIPRDADGLQAMATCLLKRYCVPVIIGDPSRCLKGRTV